MLDLDAGVDYCTSWWDGIPTWLGGTGTEWRHCCRIHDLSYATDGFFGSFQGDIDLGVCVASAAGWAMGGIMTAGVLVFGTAIKLGIANMFRPGRSDGQGR